MLDRFRHATATHDSLALEGLLSAGSVYSAGLDGSNRRTLLGAQGNLTGIAYVELP